MESSAPLTRRQLLRAAAQGGALIGSSALLAQHPGIARALAAPPACGRLEDIEHVVILIQENRSFDHYFGTYRGVRGFADRRVPHLSDGSGLNAFAQPGYPVPGYGGHLRPFHIDSSANGECTNDINHSWAPQHTYWHDGRLDAFLTGHTALDGPANAPLTMGYYARRDLAFYYALADAFTLCDGYHCSVLGPTDPNRLYAMTGTLDPDGRAGGPILSTSTTRIERFGKLTWTTMPEQLTARGVSWKVYGSPDGNYGDNVLPYFKNFLQNPSLLANALAPSFPGTFELDALLGTLPQVSWILAPLLASEHPPAPVEFGEAISAQVVSALTANSAAWAKTALFITHDENGGFFDHVRPPTPPPGTPAEFLTVSPLPAAAGGVAGPVGLGFRVPMLVVSPFSRGGFVCSDTFDHTSLLRFLETRFGVEVPNLSAWRRSVTGDLTTAFNFAAPDRAAPALPQPSLLDTRVLLGNCLTAAPLSLVTEAVTGLGALESTLVTPYPVPPPPQAQPGQEPGTAPTPSGPVACPA